MISEDKRETLEDEYGMPVERLMYHFYWEREMSSGDIANELAEIDGLDTVYRSNVRYWLQKAGIKMRTRTLSDVQRIMIIAYIDAGYGDGSIANRVDCGHMTVNRYRKEIEAAGGPADISMSLSPSDQEILEGIVGSWDDTDANSQVRENET